MWPILSTNISMCLLVFIYSCNNNCWLFYTTFLTKLSYSTVRHLGFVPSVSSAKTVYSNSELKTIKRKSPKNRLSPDVWAKLNELGIRKAFRGKASGKKRNSRCGHPVVESSTASPSCVPRLCSFLPNIIYCNAQSVAHKIDELQVVAVNNKANIVAVSESWLNPSIPDSSVSISDFVCFRRDRPSLGGGVCLYIHPSVPCIRLNDYEVLEVESLWIELRPHRTPRVVSAILVAVVYHPTSCGANENRVFLQHLQTNVEAFLRKHPEGLILVTGDFNPSSTGLSLAETKRMTGLVQIVKVLTRDTGILDWCLTNQPNLFSSPKQLPKLGKSDHYTISISPNDNYHSVKNISRTVLKRDMRPSRIREFGSWITQQSWRSVFDKPLVQDKFETFTRLLYSAVDLYLPYKRVKLSSSDKPWVSSKLKRLIAKRQNTLHILGKESDLFKQYRNAVQRECAEAKKRYFDSKVAALKSTNIKRWWAEIKKIKGETSSSSWYLQLLDDQCSSPQALAELFNQFLGSLTSDFTPLPPPEPGLFYPTPPEFLIDDYIAYRALNEVKVNKSSGPDSTPNRIWKEFAFELAPVIKDIYNASLIQGFIPGQLKESIVSPIPKCSPPKSLESDLRPVSLTSQFSKLLEGFTFKSLFNQVRDHLDDKQFAVAGKSTTHALVYFLHTILDGLDSGGKYARVLFTDFSKGFDLVDHNALVHELELLGVHDCLTRWVSSFLTNRRQTVKIEGELSSTISPRGGIPQGTKLAPLLFAVLVNRLAEDWRSRIKYVDDATVLEVIPRCSPSYLPVIAEGIRSYAASRRMKLNEKKCKEMVIDFLQYKPTILSPLMIGGSVVERISVYKLLGVYISSDLSWNTHCEYLFEKASKRLFGLRVLKKSGLSSQDLVSVFCAIIRSTLEYASPAWAALPEYLSELLERVQKKALRIIFPGLSYEEAIQMANIETLRVRRDESCRSFAKESGCISGLFKKHITQDLKYNLRSGQQAQRQALGRTERFNDFITVKYQ